MRRAKRAPVRPANRLRALALGACLAVLLWLGTELMFAAAMAFGGPQFVWSLGLRRPGDGPALLGREALMRAYSRQFDAELGWDNPPRGPFNPATADHAHVSAYGDSFTESTGPDELTWEAHLSRLTREDVLNFGISAYGPDQALLKLKRFYPRYRTPVVLFGFLGRDISRIVNVYGSARLLEETGTFLLNGRPYFMPTKPRFVLDGGRLRLLENPVRNEADFLRLAFEPEFAGRFAANDYFKKGYDLDRYVPQVRFPYLWTVPRALWLRMANRAPLRDHALQLMNDREAVRLLQAIFDEFIDLSRRESFQGIVVLFGEADELSYYVEHGQHRLLAPVVDYLRQKGHPYIDTIEILARYRRSTAPTDPISRYYDATNHHSAYAHQVIAKGMQEYLSSQVQRPPRAGAAP